ncbi:MAG: biotin synthase BioB [Chitinispirillaceae bacterium]
MNYFSTADKLFQKAIADKIDEKDLELISEWPLEKISVLFAAADGARTHFCGKEVDPCTLMSIRSGGCGEDCAFCSQSAHNSTDVKIQELAHPDEISRRCEQAYEAGFPFCVVSSGRRLTRKDLETVLSALSGCRGEKHASLGILSDEEFSMLVRAGVTCYNHNLETSRSYFPKIVTTHSYDERVDTVRRAKRAGLNVCCGGIFGLGETWTDRIEFCLELRELDVDTVPINFLNAIPGTRVSPPRESPMEFLKIVSMFRLALPSKCIKVCGGREVNLGSLQSMIFLAGANGYVSGGYLTTPGAGTDADDRMIRALGLEKRVEKEKSGSGGV